MSFEDYYKRQTNKIITNSIIELEKDPFKTFHWCDLAFFDRWWQDQSEAKRDSVKALVEKGQLIFMGGGWVMNDEALPSYSQILMNFDVGLSYLDDLFGVRPNIGWQVDPFGQSKVHVSILSKLGHDGLISNRISKTIKNELRRNYGYSFEWKGHDVSWNDKTSVVAHYLEYFYVLPQVRMD
jgi:alpha-mannosidase